MTLANKYKPGFSERPPSDEQARLRRLCEMTWEVKTLLAKFPKDACKEALELNGMFVSEKASVPGMLHGLTDGLISGVLPPCPWCNGCSLELEGSLLRCCEPWRSNPLPGRPRCPVLSPALACAPFANGQSTRRARRRLRPRRDALSV